MQRKRAWLSNPGLVVIFAASMATPVICLWPESTSVDEDERIRPLADCTASEAEVERLGRRTRELDAYLQRLSASYQDAAHAAATQQAAESTALAAEPMSPPRADASEGLDEYPTETYEARFLRDFERERADQQRGIQVARALATQLTRTSPETRVESVECTSSMCRCVLQHQTRWAQTSIDSSLDGLELQMSGVEYNYDETNGAPRTITYVFL